VRLLQQRPASRDGCEQEEARDAARSMNPVRELLQVIRRMGQEMTELRTSERELRAEVERLSRRRRGRR
jgi:hypothetical protein